MADLVQIVLNLIVFVVALGLVILFFRALPYLIICGILWLLSVVLVGMPLYLVTQLLFRSTSFEPLVEKIVEVLTFILGTILAVFLTREVFSTSSQKPPA
jgi:hypothetical protein